MRSLIYSLIPLLLLIGCQPGGESANTDAQARKVAKYTIEQFMDNTQIRGGSFFADEKSILVSSNQSGVYNAYRMRLPGGEMEAITQSDSSSIYGVAAFPEDDRIFFQQDAGGDGSELTHLFVRNEDGTMIDLIKKLEAKSFFMGWSDDYQYFYYGSNERDPRFFDVYRGKLSDLSTELLYQNDEGFQGMRVSGDGQYMTLSRTITREISELYLYAFASGELKQISPEGAKASFSPAYFSKDGQHLYYTTDQGGEFTYLSRYELANGEQKVARQYEWDVLYAAESHKGTFQLVGINADAQTELHIYDQSKGGKEIEFPEVPSGQIGGVSMARSETQMIFSVGSSASPTDKYHYDFSTQQLTRLTQTLNPEIKPEDLVEGKVIRYASFDGEQIPSILYKPHEASESQPVPALVWVHGGPGGQSRLSYFPLVQYLVNHGYAILAVNNRGSSGYGKTFFGLDDRNHGEGDLKDCIWGKKYLSDLGYVDSSRIGIIGGSYGGYMTMAALAFAPQEFEVGVDIFGVTNWLRTLKSIPPWWSAQKDALYNEMGDPNTEDSVRLYNISPLFHAHQIQNPFMVLQGANDPRVLKVESDEIVEAARNNGVEVEYVLFEDEGHGFRKTENEIEGYGKVLTFLDKHLKGGG
jgi:dipeptidyl aminopeptidase/acylaminoacyl peptidase